jgi:murein L,D-transpeptidase YafK
MAEIGESGAEPPPRPRNRPSGRLKARAVTLGSLLAAAAVLASADPQPVAGPIVGGVDRIVVDKSERRMVLLHEGRTVRRYKVALGRGGAGPKTREGDGKVPEGAYRIIGRNPRSAYHLSLRIDYPTPAQKRAAAAAGVDPGGDIMIHGIGNGLGAIGRTHRLLDWTQGCIAVTDAEIEEIWQLVPDGTPIDIRA